MDNLEFTDKEVKAFHRIITENIKNLRKSKNITQLDLALTIGHKSMSTIGKIEAGLEDKHYNVEQLYKIAKALDVNICEFFQDTKIKTTDSHL
ncbi:helix-turn-helix transcriptional regulator [bacterium]|nr:helix-turn-helix transcriptional regulator [bacterium]MBU1956969.1 helix-turn-helix transcriptional regulator [bacterium]